MPTSVSNQAYIFLWSIIGGMSIGFIYDIFRIKRKAIKTGTIFIYVEDFLYWVVVALVMFSVVYHSNDGEFRGFIFLGTLLGVVLYALMLSRLVIKTSMFFIKAICKICIAIWTVVSYPVKILFKLLAVPGRFAARKTASALKKVRRTGRSTIHRTAIWRRIFRNSRKKI